MFLEGNRQLRRECGLSDFRGRILVIRRIDVRCDEKVEDARVPLSSLSRWLGDELNVSRLAGLCLQTDVAWSPGAISREELRRKLEQAFQSRALVVVRVAEHAAGAASQDTSEADASSAAQGEERGLFRGWRLHQPSGLAIVAKESDVTPAVLVEQPIIPIRRLDTWLADVSGRATLVEMFKAVYGPDDLDWAGVLELKAKLASAFEKRKLVMLRQIDTGAGDSAGGDGKGGKGDGDKGGSDRKSKPPAETKQVKTWIAFQLVDDDGLPVAGEPYRIRITDGSVREGVLGEDGEVRIRNIDPGTCHICFPELDANEWRPV